MEVKIGDKVTKKTWCNSDMFITVEWVAPSKDGIWLNFAGTDGEGHKDIWTMNIADLEILPLEKPKYSFGEAGDNEMEAVLKSAWEEKLKDEVITEWKELNNGEMQEIFKVFPCYQELPRERKIKGLLLLKDWVQEELEKAIK